MMLHQVLHDDPRPPRSLNDRIPRDLDTVCLKAMAKEPSRRYQTARALADDLRRWLNGEPIHARPIGAIERTAKWIKRNPTKATVIALISVGLLAGVVVLEYTRRATRATALVQALAAADAQAVPTIIKELPGYRWWADPQLRGMCTNESSEKSRLHASLALLPADPTQVEYLRERLLTASPAEIMIIRQALAPHADDVNPRLWTVAEDPAAPLDQRLRALAALAGLDPESERWQPLAAPLAQRLVTENPLLVGQWLEAFRPVRVHLLLPLGEVCRRPLTETDEPDLERTVAEFQQRSIAVNILADYAADQPAVLADLLLDADARQYAVLWTPFAKVSDQGMSVLLKELDRKLADEETQDGKERLAKRQANAAVALLRLGKPEPVWPILQHSPDPRVRSYLIHYLSPKGADAATLIARFKEEKDVTIRRALLLALGEYATSPDRKGGVIFSFPNSGLGTHDRETPFRNAPEPRPGNETEFRRQDVPKQEFGNEGLSLIPELLTLYRTHPDAGLHAAAEWLLRKWGQGEAIAKIDRELAEKARERLASGGREPPVEPQIEPGLAARQQGADAPRSPTPSWFVNSQGQTLVVIPGPVEFLMGSPERQHRRRIPRSFAIAAKEVSVEQFLRFRKNYNYNKEYARSPDCPINTVSWYEAAEYCNWLSEQEGIPKEQWCYLPNEQGKYADGMKAAPDYLTRTGYRLPTEAEWEYCCRAGSLTARYYGETDDLLKKYAWYTKNSGDRCLLPGGALKPNDFGLFDMQGNALEWCHDIPRVYPQGEVVEDLEQKGDVVKNDQLRVLRGGSFYYPARDVRSSNRSRNRPDLWFSLVVGLRVARTL
jgi:formylglycine-generating enzyme required for sulfatase activity